MKGVSKNGCCKLAQERPLCNLQKYSTRKGASLKEMKFGLRVFLCLYVDVKFNVMKKKKQFITSFWIPNKQFVILKERKKEKSQHPYESVWIPVIRKYASFRVMWHRLLKPWGLLYFALIGNTRLILWFSFLLSARSAWFGRRLWACFRTDC